MFDDRRGSAASFWIPSTEQVQAMNMAERRRRGSLRFWSKTIDKPQVESMLRPGLIKSPSVLSVDSQLTMRAIRAARPLTNEGIATADHAVESYHEPAPPVAVRSESPRKASEISNASTDSKMSDLELRDSNDSMDNKLSKKIKAKCGLKMFRKQVKTPDD